MKLQEFYDLVDNWSSTCKWRDYGAIIPESSGVYMICHKCNIQRYEILYIGSSKNLRKRKSHHMIWSMLRHFYKTLEFYYIETKEYRQKEIELIAKYRPEFNNHWK